MEFVHGQAKEPCGMNLEQLSQLEDADLMAHLRSGHNDALAVLFSRYHRLILSVAFKILRDPLEAEDVMQTVFLEVCRVAKQYDAGRGTVKVWLLQYAYHRSMNRREYLNVRGFYDRGVANSHPAQAHEVSIEDAGPDRMSLPEARYLVQEGLESLNPSQRNVLHMAYFEDMPLKEIAERTGISMGNVRHHYYRALLHLRSMLLISSRNGNGNRTRSAKQEIDKGEIVDVEG